MTKSADFARYVAACDFVGAPDEEAVERHLADYCRALGVSHQIVRLRRGWGLDEHASLRRNVRMILENFAKRTGRGIDAIDAIDAIAALAARAAIDAIAARAAIDALAASDARAASDAIAASDASAARDAIAASAASDAIAASAARDARDALAARDASDAIAASDASAARDAIAASDARALHRFAAWCIFRAGWWWWDLSWLALTEIGAQQIRKTTVSRWAKPVLEAYVAGCWLIYWTDDTLYWIARPTLTRDPASGTRRLHCETGPALENDVQNLYFWRGVLVPAHVVMRPDWITVKQIEREDNVEVRRIMIERYGLPRYLQDSGARPIDHEEGIGTLLRKDEGDDAPILMVEVINSTPEPDGSFKRYFLDVSGAGDRLLDDRPGPRAGKPSARAAVAATFGLRASEYRPAVET